MNSKFTPWYFLLIIILIHFGGIAYAVMSNSNTVKKDIVEPTIQGVLIAEKKVAPTPPKPKPKPKHRHRQKHHKHKPLPLPKAPVSEHAVKAEPPPIEEPVEKPVEETPEPAPTVVPPRAGSELDNPAPAYPHMSRKLKEEGKGLLTILVTKEGQVAEITIKQSSGFSRLDDAAVKAIKRWKFNPATQAGVAIDYLYEVPFEFNLRKK